MKKYTENYLRQLLQKELKTKGLFNCSKCGSTKPIDENTRKNKRGNICRDCKNKAEKDRRLVKERLYEDEVKEIKYASLIIYLCQKPFFDEMKKDKKRLRQKKYEYHVSNAIKSKESYKNNPGYQRLKRSIYHLFGEYIRTEQSFILAGSQRLIKLVERKAISYEEAQTIGKELIINPYEVAPKIFQITKIN